MRPMHAPRSVTIECSGANHVDASQKGWTRHAEAQSAADVAARRWRRHSAPAAALRSEKVRWLGRSCMVQCIFVKKGVKKRHPTPGQNFACEM